MKPINLPEPGKPDYGTIDPLDNRYFDPEIARFVSESSRLAYQAHVEAALAQTLADFSLCTREIADEIGKSAANIDPDSVYKEEKTTRHDIKALVNVIKKPLSDEAKPFVHFGATSYDIIANANVLQMRDVVNEVLLPRINQLVLTLISLSEEYAETTQVGRTHGQHAVPITFGFAISEYVTRLGESSLAIRALTEQLEGKFSGAVGAYNALSVFTDDPLEFENTILAKIDLEPAQYSTQILPAEKMIRLIDEMTITAGIMANLGHDMRHLQRSEIAEVREKFEEGQTGSSTMAHKRNPWNFENVASMYKQVLSQSLNANLNISSEHQRDLTDSGSSRYYVLVPALLAGMAKRLDTVMQKLEVDHDSMERNLKLSAGAIAAEPLYLLFEKYGHVEAHEMAKNLAHKATNENKSLAEAVKNDAEASKYWNKFSDNEKNIIEQPEKFYTGLAAKKSRLISDDWKKRLKN